MHHHLRFAGGLFLLTIVVVCEIDNLATGVRSWLLSSAPTRISTTEPVITSQETQCRFHLVGECQQNTTLSDAVLFETANDERICKARLLELQQRCGSTVGVALESSQNSTSNLTILDTDGSLLDIEVLDLKPRQSCYRMTRSSLTVDFCFPLINIHGFPKAGTSYWYYALTRHPQLAAANPNKEYCPNGQTYFEYLSGLAHATTQHGYAFLVNACIHQMESWRVESLLQPRYAVDVLLVRDAAEWAWSRYNFFCDPDTEPRCTSGGWARTGLHERSPQAFHDELLAVDAGIVPKRQMITSREELANIFSGWIDRFDRLRLGSTVHVIANEKMSANLTNVWDRFANHVFEETGIHLVDHPKLNRLSGERINTGNDRGVNHVSVAAAQGLYQTSNFEPMLGKTKELLRSWWGDCPEVRERSGWPYACKETL